MAEEVFFMGELLMWIVAKLMTFERYSFANVKLLQVPQRIN